MSDLYSHNFTSSGHPKNFLSLVRVLTAIDVPVFVIFRSRRLPSLAKSTLVLRRLGFPGLNLVAGMTRNLFMLVLIF